MRRNHMPYDMAALQHDALQERPIAEVPLNEIDARACRSLWQGVLVEVLRGISSSKVVCMGRDPVADRAYLKTADFERVCELAGFDPEYIRAAYTDEKMLKLRMRRVRRVA